MKRKIYVALTPKSIDRAVKYIRVYEKEFKAKCKELCSRLADIGVTKVSFGYAGATYQGKRDIRVRTIVRGYKYTLQVKGVAAVVIEFGAGVTQGYGHPLANELGVGPGTFPDAKGHWDNPDGWFIPKDKVESGDWQRKTYGNPPAQVMYNTAKELAEEIENIAREVFMV